ncbi:hypothetical protein [Beihai Nido-like virus 2]|uniref:Uncharacterized protein n=1 Tax=Beihai Nido-like virus 2 TaxID=1922351 RepID=A0A1L3KIU4_9NIDO|nr:hypothetical protein [Beihai Nido-like virus 2]APG77320.1 hypothetical protein [Beihai Nido-like virus 2]
MPRPQPRPPSHRGSREVAQAANQTCSPSPTDHPQPQRGIAGVTTEAGTTATVAARTLITREGYYLLKAGDLVISRQKGPPEVLLSVPATSRVLSGHTIGSP